MRGFFSGVFSTAFSVIALAMVIILAAGCQGGGDEKYQAGKHYLTLPQAVRTSDAAKIEVVEVFWYGCPHCYKYTSKVKVWADTLADDVKFVRNPATLGRPVEFHTRVYYAAKALKKQEEIHIKLFSAYHDQKNTLLTERDISSVFLDAGVSREKFVETFDSFGVRSQSMQAESREKGYRLTGTPCLIINGKYRITGESAGSQDGMFEVAEFLIEKERTLEKQL